MDQNSHLQTAKISTIDTFGENQIYGRYVFAGIYSGSFRSEEERKSIAKTMERRSVQVYIRYYNGKGIEVDNC
jgi:hypothetical protein